MASHYLPELLEVEPFEVWELSAFLVHAGFRPLPRNDGRRVAYHDSCHMLRELGISAEPRRLLGASGAELVPFARPDLCCGFGGTFSVRQPEVSLARRNGQARRGRRRQRSSPPTGVHDALARACREARLAGAGFVRWRRALAVGCG
jgi:Fe-S oxidoreductase